MEFLELWTTDKVILCHHDSLNLESDSAAPDASAGDQCSSHFRTQRVQGASRCWTHFTHIIHVSSTTAV